jgi:autoinducer 2-degrading protein
MNNAVLLVELQVKPECLDQFNEAIRVNSTASVGEPGCRQFDVLRSQDDPCRVFLYEVYENADAVKAHVGQVHTQKFLGLAKGFVTKQTMTRLARTFAPAKPI